MDTALLSFIGIVVGFVIFVILAFKNYNLLFSATCGAIAIIVFSGQPLMKTLDGVYMTSLAGLIKSFLMLFVLGAVMGKLLEDSGAARKLALTLANMTRRSRHMKFWTVMLLPLFYTFLSYVGISGFVVVFTVVAIGRELFEECDLPWWLYCYGSAGIYTAISIAGSLQVTNIVATQAFKVPLTAGFTLSLFGLAANLVTMSILVIFDLRKAEKNGEGFLPTGAAIKKLQLAPIREEKELPSLLASSLPFVVCLAAIISGKMGAVTSLAISSFLGFIVLKNKLKSIKETLSQGIVMSLPAAIHVAAATGFVAILRNVPGYAIIAGQLDSLPSFLPAAGNVILVSGVVASSSSGITAIIGYLTEKMAETGISNEISARLCVLSTFSYMTPHSPGIINAVMLTKLDFKQAAWMYFKTTTFPGFAAFAVCAILVMLGVYK